MPNTKSAERRLRNSTRRHLHNQSIKSRLKTLEKAYLALVTAGNRNEASAALRTVAVDIRKPTVPVPESVVPLVPQG